MGKTAMLPWAKPLTGGELIEVEQGGAPKKMLFTPSGPGPRGSFVWGTGTGNILDQGDLVTYVNGLPVKAHTHSADDITTGVLPALRGGTGINTYIAGQLLVAASTSALTALNPGTNGKVLMMVAGTPAWANPTGWQLNGNNIGSGDFIGSANDFDLKFATNNKVQAAVKSGGGLYIATQYTSGGLPGNGLHLGVVGKDTSTFYISGDKFPAWESGYELAFGSLTDKIFRINNSGVIAKNLTINGNLVVDNAVNFGVGVGGIKKDSPNVSLWYSGSAGWRGTILNNTTHVFIADRYGNISLGSTGAGSCPASATFIINSTTQGSIPAPKMNSSLKLSISAPAEALTVYDETLHKFSFWNGTAWETIGGSGGSGGSVVDLSSSTVTGWSSFTTKKIFYQLSGKVLRLFFHLDGTSNSTQAYFNLPTGIIAHADLPEQWQDAKILNNGAAATGYLAATANSGTVNLYRTFSVTNWGSTGTKTCIGCATILIN